MIEKIRSRGESSIKGSYFSFRGKLSSIDEQEKLSHLMNSLAVQVNSVLASVKTSLLKSSQDGIEEWKVQLSQILTQEKFPFRWKRILKEEREDTRKCEEETLTHEKKLLEEMKGKEEIKRKLSEEYVKAATPVNRSFWKRLLGQRTNVSQMKNSADTWGRCTVKLALVEIEELILSLKKKEITEKLECLTFTEVNIIPLKESKFIAAREYLFLQRDKIKKQKEEVFKHGFIEEVRLPESHKARIKQLFEIDSIMALAAQVVEQEGTEIEKVETKVSEVIDNVLSDSSVLNVLKETHPSGTLEAHLQELPVTKASPLISFEKTYMPETPEPVCLFTCNHKERIEAMNLDLREVALKIITETESPFMFQVLTFSPPVPAFALPAMAKWQETALEREKKGLPVFPERGFGKLASIFL